MRNALLKRVRPLVDRFAAELTALAVTRIERELERMEESFEVALSLYETGAYESDGPHDLLTQALGPDLARMLSGDDGKRGSRQPAPHATQQGAATPGQSASSAAGNVAEPQRAPTGHKRSSNGKAWPSCSLCGKVGVSARTHPAHVVDRDIKPENMAPERPRAKTDPDAKPLTALAPERPRAPTPQEIEELKARRKERIARAAAHVPARSPRPVDEPVDDNPNADERWSASEIADETTRAEASKHEGELPVARSTFVVHGRAINFGDEG